jgi:hypothetical protein
MFREKKDRMLLPLKLLFLGCLLARVQIGWAGEFRLEEVGGRFGLAAERADAEFHQAEVLVNFDLPWSWTLDHNWRLQSRLDTSGGWLGDSRRAAAVLTAGPTLELGYGKVPISLEGGLSPTFISRDEFTHRDFGSHYQFTTHIDLNADLGSHLRLSYRFQHMSNGGFIHPNPGLNMHFLGVSYRF